MDSVLALSSFKTDFGLPIGSSGFANAKNAKVSSNVVSLLTAGCFFGAIAAAFLNDRFGKGALEIFHHPILSRGFVELGLTDIC